MEKTKNKKRSLLLMLAFAIGFVSLCAFTAITWKTYSNKYITFRYPDTYKITDEEESENTYELCCEINNDDISMVQITITNMEGLSYLSEQDRRSALREGVKAMKEEVMGSGLYKNASCSEIKSVTKGNNSGYYFTFDATMFGIHVLGEAFMAFSGERMLVYVAQAENARYMSQLDDIVVGFRVK